MFAALKAAEFGVKHVEMKDVVSNSKDLKTCLKTHFYPLALTQCKIKSLLNALIII